VEKKVRDASSLRGVCPQGKEKENRTRISVEEKKNKSLSSRLIERTLQININFREATWEQKRGKKKRRVAYRKVQKRRRLHPLLYRELSLKNKGPFHIVYTWTRGWGKETAVLLLKGEMGSELSKCKLRGGEEKNPFRAIVEGRGKRTLLSELRDEKVRRIS